MRIGFTACLLVAAAAGPTAQVLELPIGDPARRDRQVAVGLDTIVDTRTGDVLTPPLLAARLEGVRLVLIGEDHTAIESHRVQARVIRALHEAGRRVLIGLEMFPYTEQASLDRWRDGRQEESEFVRSSRWYEHWGYHWGYYRDLFVLAREHGLPMFAINAPPAVISAVRENGLEALSDEQAGHLPADIDASHPEHLRLFKAYFAQGDATHGGGDEALWQRMLAAQAAWDASMAHHAVRALEAADPPDAVMVVLAGSGHVAYGLGIARQAARRFDGEVVTVIPVSIPAGRVEATVQASYADVVWGVPAEPAPAYPRLGISTRSREGHAGRVVILVEPTSPAGQAGFRHGDEVLSVDGEPVTDRESLNRLIAQKTWGDSVTFAVRRGDEDVELVVPLRRTP